MSFEADYRTALLAYTPLQALVGNRIGVRLAQHADFPSVRFQRLSTERIYTMRGRNLLCLARVQNDCWSADNVQALDIADKFIRALDSFGLTTPSPGSPAVYPNKPNFVLNQIFSIEPEPEPVLYRVMVDTKIYFLDSA